MAQLNGIIEINEQEYRVSSDKTLSVEDMRSVDTFKTELIKFKNQINTELTRLLGGDMIVSKEEKEKDLEEQEIPEEEAKKLSIIDDDGTQQR
jgi:hypothetical protein